MVDSCPNGLVLKLARDSSSSVSDDDTEYYLQHVDYFGMSAAPPLFRGEVPSM